MRVAEFKTKIRSPHVVEFADGPLTRALSCILEPDRVPSQSQDAGGVAGRYASALFSLAEEADCLDAVAGDLRALVEAAEASPEFARVLDSPVLPRQQQADAVGAVADSLGAHALTRKFLGVLATQRRLPVLRPAVRAFLVALAERRGEVQAEVVSAQPMGETQRKALNEALSGVLGSRIALAERVDPALVGGMIVRVGSRMVDFSIATKLQKLRLSMKGIG